MPEDSQIALLRRVLEDHARQLARLRREQGISLYARFKKADEAIEACLINMGPPYCASSDTVVEVIIADGWRNSDDEARQRLRQSLSQGSKRFITAGKKQTRKAPPWVGLPEVADTPAWKKLAED